MPTINLTFTFAFFVEKSPPLASGTGPLIPYGLPCVRELFRFLISLTNPLDRHNTDVMIHMGLSLITVALESGADAITSYTSLMVLVKDDILKNLFFVSIKVNLLSFLPWIMSFIQQSSFLFSANPFALLSTLCFIC